MNIVNTREAVIELSHLNTFDRFPDGRPRVPDGMIRRLKLVTTEETWGVLRGHSYLHQFEGHWFRIGYMKGLSQSMEKEGY